MAEIRLQHSDLPITPVAGESTLYISLLDGHLKKVTETGAVIDLETGEGTTSPGGASGQIQYNAEGTFAGFGAITLNTIGLGTGNIIVDGGVDTMSVAIGMINDIGYDVYVMGNTNTAPGGGSHIIGQANIAVEGYSYIFGKNNIDYTSASTLIGDSNRNNSHKTIAIGAWNILNGAVSYALGYNNQTNTGNSIAIGIGANSYLEGQEAFRSSEDARGQSCRLVYGALTPATTATRLIQATDGFLNDYANLTVPDSTVWNLSAKVIGLGTLSKDISAYNINVVVKNVDDVLTVSYQNVTELINELNNAVITVDVDQSYKRLNIIVSGNDVEEIEWTASIDWVENKLWILNEES